MQSTRINTIVASNQRFTLSSWTPEMWFKVAYQDLPLRWGALGKPIQTRLLDFHYFLFLGTAHFLHLLDFVIGEALDFLQGTALIVFRDLLVLERLLDKLVSVAADVADGSAVLFQDFVQMLDHVAAALLGQGRDGHANDLAVVHGIEPEVTRPDGLFDVAQRTGIKRLHGDELGLGRVNLRDLIERHGGTVVFHLHAVEHVYGSAAGAYRGHLPAEIVHRLIHPALQGGIRFLQPGNRRHGCLRHRFSLVCGITAKL